MTDPIRLSVADVMPSPTGDKYQETTAIVVITPAIARQIVALAAKDSPPVAQPAPAPTVGASGVWQIDTSRTTGINEGNYPSAFPVAQPAPAASVDTHAFIGGFLAPIQKPAAPVDDEATVNALCAITGLWVDSDGRLEVFAGRLISSAIRRGEVPGLTTIDKCSDLINEHARAVNARDAAQAEVERLRGESAKHSEWRDRHRKERESLRADLKEKRQMENEAWFKTWAAERDSAIARAEKAEAERDAAQAEVERLRSSENAQLIQSRETVKVLSAEVERLENKLDDVLSSPDAIGDHYRKMQAKTYQELISERNKISNLQAEVKRLREKLKAEQDAREAAVEELMAKNELDEHYNAKLNDAQAAHAEAVALLLEWRGHKRVMEPRILIDETDAHLAKHGGGK